MKWNDITLVISNCHGRTLTQLIAMLLSTFTCLQASAAWELFVEMQEGKVYIDRTTLKRVGSTATMSSLTELTFSEKELRETPPSFRSIKYQEGFDCTKQRARVQGYTLYSGSMATGTAFMQYDKPTPWTAVDPKNQISLKWRTACSMELR